MEIENIGGEALLKLIKDNKKYVLALQLIGIKYKNFRIVTDEQLNEVVNIIDKLEDKES